ncbi:thiosulfate sulfurtransferase-like [Gigantopelta aegis]|uniref:thiosulfate sulfurtransferase-like n=1 Tax=Gigantopelta aegis TaxID=1735272 RepID=UPI001B88931C|nr:thiosulfate sulfurtransferase-like [Gigantopelta aegis]
MGLSRVRTLVGTNWLKEQLFSKTSKGGPLRVLDTTWKPKNDTNYYEEYYKKSHIPTSVYFNPDECVQSIKLIQRNLPELNCFNHYIQRLGIASDTHIIAYDQFTSRSALRTWWLFRVFGHSKISILDGGFKKWLDDGYEVSTEEPQVEKTDYLLQPNFQLMRDYDAMVKNVKSKVEQMVDARSWEEFSGQKELEKPDDLKTGHIPGARNIPFEDLFNEDGTFKSDKDLKILFDKAEIDLNKPLVASCLTGLTACGLAAAAHCLGKDVPVYFGSWKEWVQRADDNMVAVVKKKE